MLFVQASWYVNLKLKKIKTIEIKVETTDTYFIVIHKVFFCIYMYVFCINISMQCLLYFMYTETLPGGIVGNEL